MHLLKLKDSLGIGKNLFGHSRFEAAAVGVATERALVHDLDTQGDEQPPRDCFGRVGIASTGMAQHGALTDDSDNRGAKTQRNNC